MWLRIFYHCLMASCCVICKSKMLVHNVRLSAEDYSWRQVARMLGVSQGCVSTILGRNQDAGRPHQWRRVGRRYMTTAGVAHRRWNLRQLEVRLSSLMSFTLLHSDGHARERRRKRERLRDACIQPRGGNHGSSVMVWVAIHRGGRSELLVQDGTFNRQSHFGFFHDSMLPWAMGVLDETMCMSRTIATPHIAREMTLQDVEVMGLPDRSPDMNPVEHGWHKKGLWIRNMDAPTPIPTSTVTELHHAVLQGWASIHPRRV